MQGAGAVRSCPCAYAVGSTVDTAVHHRDAASRAAAPAATLAALGAPIEVQRQGGRADEPDNDDEMQDRLAMHELAAWLLSWCHLPPTAQPKDTASVG